MLGRSKEKTVLYIDHKKEILIWLIIILIFVAMSSTGFIFKEKNDLNDYQIFLQDVDGLIVGSPVRMMGIEVGHITKIKPTNQEVYVKFVLDNPDVFIPQGTVATVEFSGMAGSKSLELYLPDKNSVKSSEVPILSVAQPKRLHDSLSLLNNMFKKLGSIIYTTSSFGTKLESEIFESVKEENSESGMKDFIKYSNKFIEDSDKKVGDIRKKIFTGG